MAVPTTAFAHFQEDVNRAQAILNHATPLPKLSDAEKLLRSDLLRSSWMFAIGALDAYCIHNCDRPRVAPQPLSTSSTVLKVIQDVNFFVRRCNEHINTEFHLFLGSIGCSAATIAAAGY
jgi:hypothetical protein